MIKLVNLTKIYNSGENVGIGIQDVNLEFHVGEFVAIVGASGSGKTTLLNIISGMDNYTEGEMFVNGVSTANFTMDDMENYRRGNVSFIFQNYQLIDSYTVLENVMVELILTGKSQKEAKIRAKEILTKVGMGHRLHHRASKLSGGEKQRVVIARAIASEAKILACDEPTGNLDTKNTQEIMAIIKEVAKEKLVLFVTHDDSLLQGNATRVIRIRDGHVESDTLVTETPTYEEALNIPPKNSFFTILYIALKNLCRTPKKTIFVLGVFLLLVFAILFSIAFIPLEMTATDNTQIEYNMYNNKDPNRIVVYNNDAFDGNYGVSQDKIIKDDFFLDFCFRPSTTSITLNEYIKDQAFLQIIKENLTLLVGRLPEEESQEKEAVLIIDENFSKSFLEAQLGNKIRFAANKSDFTYFSDYYTIVGFATSNYYNEDRTDVYINHLDDFKTKMINNLKLRKEFSNIYEDDFVFQFEGQKSRVFINQKLTKIEDENGNSSDPIRVSFRYRDKDFSLFLGNKKIDLERYGCYYFYDDTSNDDVQISPDLACKILQETPYRVSIYAGQSEIDSIIGSLRNNSNLEIYPLREAIRNIPQYDYVGILKNLFYFIFIFIEIIACLFIASLITSFILGSKKKELGVLRVIGLSQKDILHVLHIELLTTMVLSIVLNIIVAVCFKFFETPISYACIFDSIPKLIVSIIILLIMSILISYRWNKKMFKHTAREILKAGDTL